MRIRKAITIIGPNGAGKTAVAFELARRMGGEVVNLDKIYLYRGFPVSSGLSDTLDEKGVKQHLYQLLNPDQEIIPADEFVEMISNTCREIIDRDVLPIIEGGSTTYFPAFHEMNKRTGSSSIIGLRFPADFDVKEKIKRRVESALDNGLLEEIKRNLPNYRDTLIMKDGHFVVPLVSYLDGNSDFETAKSKIIERCMEYADRQMKLFKEYSDILWLEHEPRFLLVTVEKIISTIIEPA